MAAPSIPVSDRRDRNIAFPLLLVALGIVFMLLNAGYLRAIRWTDLVAVSPILLVLGGVDMLVRPRSFLAAFVIEIAIIVATLAYIFSGVTLMPVATSFESIVPRAGVSEMTLTFNYGGGALAVTGGGSDLVSVQSTREDVSQTVDQSGAVASVVLSSKPDNVFMFGGDRRWDVTLPSDVRTSATFNLGAGDFDLDLSSIRMTRATINGGACDLMVALPRPSGDVPIGISTGASSVELRIPAGVEYRVEDTGALHSVTGVKQSAGYATAADRLTIRVSAAMSSVVIK